MDAADPLCVASSAACLLPRTLGGPAPAASPSKADEALLRGISRRLKGSKELLEQAKMVMKEHGDIGMVYQDDGTKAATAANGKENLLGRRPAGDRKRNRFSYKPPASKPSLPAVDRSILDTISDPDLYFAAVAQLDEAEAEIKYLSGQVQPKKTYSCHPIVEKRRNPSRQRKSYSFKGAGAHTANATNAPTSQSGTMTESQIPQDDAHATVSGTIERPVPSRPDKCAILDGSAKEDSFAEMDKGDDLTRLLTVLQNDDSSDEQDLIRKTLGLKQLNMEKILGEKPLRSTARNPTDVHSTERHLPGSQQIRVSELEKGSYGGAAKDKSSDLLEDEQIRMEKARHLDSLSGTLEARFSELEKCIFGNLAKDKDTDLSEDDESEGSPDIVMGEQSLVRDSSDVGLMTNETVSARETDRETPSPSVKSAEHVVDPEPSMPDYPCSRNNTSSEQVDVPMDYSTIDKSYSGTDISSHHLEGISTEVLFNKPGRNVGPDDIARTSHAAEDNIQLQEVVQEDGVVQDKSIHALEIPLEDIGPQNQSQVPDGTIKKLAADLGNALFPTNLTKVKTRKAAQKVKNKQQMKRGKKMADELSHPPEIPQAIPQANFDSENQSHTHDPDIEQQTGVTRTALSPTKAKGQKDAQRRKKTEKMNKRRSLADAGLAWQSGVRRSTRIRSRPLDYWRGERFIYGRIHDTMVTVIGIKTYSPDQDGKRALKVKSFVPEQYADVVAQGGKY